MPRLPRLPRHRSDTWAGGFVFDTPVYTASIAARGGTVLAATERIYRLAPGSTRWQFGEIPEGHGDVTSVAVEPRRRGQPTRMAVASIGALHLFEGDRVTTQPLPGEHDEIHDMMMAPRAGGLDPTICLYLNFGGKVLRLLPDDGGPVRKFEGDFWPGQRPDGEVRGMAFDGERGVAFAVIDEEHDELDVWALIDFEANRWGRRSIPIASSFDGIHLAVAGTAVAVAFKWAGGVWLTRDLREHDFVEVEPYRETENPGYDRGAVLAFECARADAALFVAAHETERRCVIARVDAAGRAEPIAELETDEGSATRLIQQMVWDETRRTLWSAAGHAGILGATAPGAPVPIGEAAGSRAPS